ncbi:LamG domain-containing protein [Mariniflexile litorale]|uniref:LamG domain-containing protein n=1 Tax=Mariniflexile litorale TaxID=3045158 RepID=A0AAU7ED26_9FLAO|nr:LamG domain-containing protein [Mariniflexile sp. KMM 9835]MDQ8212123.1 LamG domain-containing protein [Mariniflexile sp. KMM 9835]
MKKFLKYIIAFFVMLPIVSCNDGIDSITEVAPGTDESAPVLNLTYPTGDIVIPFTDTETDLNIIYKVIDDIEIGSVSVMLDGIKIDSKDRFLDYRIFFGSVIHKKLQLGNHEMQISATDLSGKTTTQSLAFNVTNKYTAKYDGEIFYMPFEFGKYTELISETDPNIIGTPAFVEGKSGTSYKGNTGSYLTFPTTGLTGGSFSAAMWYKLTATPSNGGILVAGPEDVVNVGYPAIQNNRKSGFRFFREPGAAGFQRFKLNVGNGTADVWVDGGSAADVATDAGWIHLAFTISPTKAIVYINGTAVKESAITGIDWTGCNILSIMSGAPRFTGWGHLSDLSYLDEFRLFDKELTPTEIQSMM